MPSIKRTKRQVFKKVISIGVKHILKLLLTVFKLAILNLRAACGPGDPRHNHSTLFIKLIEMYLKITYDLLFYIFVGKTKSALLIINKKYVKTS